MVPYGTGCRLLKMEMGEKGECGKEYRDSGEVGKVKKDRASCGFLVRICNLYFVLSLFRIIMDHIL